MEMFELRYFLAVARFESVARAADEIHVSAAALSKAVSRLEDELKTPLFFKSGRAIRLTPEGLVLKERAARIVRLEEDTRQLLAGRESGDFNVIISGEEILQASFGLRVAGELDRLFPGARTRFWLRDEAGVIEQVMSGEAHLGLITQEAPRGVSSRILAPVEFKTCVGSGHVFARKRSLMIEEVLDEPFVVPEAPILGRIAKSSSTDGWRDDKFPRKIKYRAGGLQLIESLVREGKAIAYLPDYVVAAHGFVPLKITGCPYTCRQTVRVIARDPGELGWLGRLWERL